MPRLTVQIAQRDRIPLIDVSVSFLDITGNIPYLLHPFLSKTSHFLSKREDFLHFYGDNGGFSYWNDYSV